MSEPVLVTAAPCALKTGLPVGTRLCAIGDVHGQSAALHALLDRFAMDCGAHDRNVLVVLGDLNDRGPDSLGAIDAVIEAVDNPAALGFDEVVPLMGNHEQMMRLTLEEQPGGDPWLWLFNGGSGVVAELGCPPPVNPTLVFGLDLDMANREFVSQLAAGLGERRLAYLKNLRSHYQEGRLLFVHAGVDPEAKPAVFLAEPWNRLDDNHWAWIREPFLNSREPVPGLVVVHGHTPVRWTPPTGSADAIASLHRLRDGRINLDGGSAASGCVAGAEFTQTDYRIVMVFEPRR
ncbi:MAG: metallophosphoesterase [Paracoccaceae bacterium]|nr:metallophosphoesterase [Paracoccaceae bacterium]MDE2913532.1 metallophosphoesterase [Paracoccaceae bacterium]